MAAPLGFKTFATGDVLTAADTNGYLMQGVWTFANAAARTAAVTSPQEGNVSFLKDTNSLEIYDGASWVAYGSGDITGVTAGTGISGGGTSGTVTVTNSMATAIDAKGDLIAGTGADAFDRLAVGTNGQVLTADSTTSTGLKWAAGGSSYKGASCYKSAAQTIATGVWSAVTFNNEYFDTDSIHNNSTNTSRFTVPTAGKWLCVFGANWGVNANGLRLIAIYKNGTAFYYANQIPVGNGTNSILMQATYVIDLAANDYVEMYVLQNSGGNLDLSGGANQTEASISYLGA